MEEVKVECNLQLFFFSILQSKASQKLLRCEAIDQLDVDLLCLRYRHTPLRLTPVFFSTSDVVDCDWSIARPRELGATDVWRDACVVCYIKNIAFQKLK